MCSTVDGIQYGEAHHQYEPRCSVSFSTEEAYQKCVVHDHQTSSGGCWWLYFLNQFIRIMNETTFKHDRILVGIFRGFVWDPYRTRGPGTIHLTRSGAYVYVL